MQLSDAIQKYEPIWSEPFDHRLFKTFWIRTMEIFHLGFTYFVRQLFQKQTIVDGKSELMFPRRFVVSS